MARTSVRLACPSWGLFLAVFLPVSCVMALLVEADGTRKLVSGFSLRIRQVSDHKETKQCSIYYCPLSLRESTLLSRSERRLSDSNSSDNPYQNSANDRR